MAGSNFAAQTKFYNHSQSLAEAAHAEAAFIRSDPSQLINLLNGHSLQGHRKGLNDALAAGPALISRFACLDPEHLSSAIDAWKYSSSLYLNQAGSAGLTHMKQRELYFAMMHTMLSKLDIEQTEDAEFIASAQMFLGHMEAAFTELKPYYTRRDLMLAKLFENTVNALMRKEIVHITRLHMRMTEANKLDRGSGRVGDSLKVLTIEALQNPKLIDSNFDLLEIEVYVDPVGTALYLKAKDKVSIETILSGLPKYLSEALSKNLDPDMQEELSQFRPNHSALYINLSVSDLMKKNLLIATLISEVHKRVAELLVNMPPATTFIEKRAASYKPMHTEEDVGSLINGDENNKKYYNQLIEGLVGFVGFGQYKEYPVSLDSDLSSVLPRMGRYIGQITRSRQDSSGDEGGLIERLRETINSLKDLNESGEDNATQRETILARLLGLLKNYTGEQIEVPADLDEHPFPPSEDTGLGLLTRMFRSAQLYFRYPRLLRPTEAWSNTGGHIENADVVYMDTGRLALKIEKEGSVKDVSVNIIELDLAKNHLENSWIVGEKGQKISAIADKDLVDTQMHEIYKVILDKAEELCGKENVIFAPFQGDALHLNFIPPDGYSSGDVISECQKALKNRYKNQFFIITHKFKMADCSIQRRPIFVAPDGTYKDGEVGQAEMAGYEPVLGHIGFTRVGINLSGTSWIEDGRDDFSSLSYALGARIDTHAKKMRTGTTPRGTFILKKEGNQLLPDELVPQSFKQN
ncbi:MAG: hypothetical protein ABIE74_08800 [Pseudomonadota bacterium]